ncbi:sensor histidine kinase [Hydrogenophaga sp.]|uniref:sensor histidine kinase n=1 Tax=Hydrogenophaga sp. TaxID=1904254 RepID=UPI003D0A520D
MAPPQHDHLADPMDPGERADPSARIDQSSLEAAPSSSRAYALRRFVRHYSLWLTLAFTLTAIGGLFLAESILELTTYEEFAEQRAEAAANAVGSESQKVVDKAQLIMGAVARVYRNRDANDGAAAVRTVVSDLNMLVPDVIDLWLVDANGALVAASERSGESNPFPLSESEVSALRQAAPNDLGWHHVRRESGSSQRSVIEIQRRVLGRNGEFLGLVVAHLEARHLDDAVRLADVGTKGVSFILSTRTGAVIASHAGRVESNEVIGLPIEAIRRSIAQNPASGRLVVGGKNVHPDWIVRYRLLETQRLAVVAMIASEDYLAPWRKELMIRLLTLVVLASLLIFFWRSAIKDAASLRFGGRQGIAVVSQGVASEILSTFDQEKRKLGQELHDGIGQKLTGLAFLSGVLERKLREKNIGAADEAEWITRLLRESVAEVRTISKGLQPVHDEDGALEQALKQLALDCSAMFGVQCTFLQAAGIPKMDVGIGNHLYRIVQEATTNAVRHGKAQTIEISLQSDAVDGVVLEVWNDGLPATAKELESQSGLGMAGMQLRAMLCGGQLSVIPNQIAGFTLLVKLPL